MNMYKEYLEELHEGKSLLFDETGFIVYWIRENEVLGKECYIEDIYVVKAHRKNGATHILRKKVEKIAKETNCDVVTGSVVPAANGATASLKMMISNGFELLCNDENTIWFKKNL